MKFLFFVSSFLLAVSAAFGPYPIDKTKISVSGLSSGGYMAVQVHVALSSKIMGAAVFAAGPYYCAQDELTDALTSCLYGFSLTAQTFIDYAETFEASGKIDKLNNLTNSNVYIFSGKGDTVVYPAVVQVLEDFYQNWTPNIVSEFTLAAQHCLPTDSFGNACSKLGTPYINDCDYDGAGKAFNTIYKNLKPKTTAVAANLISFKQADYMPALWTPASASMAATGYAYIPTGCQEDRSNKSCRLHFAFHGCQQTTADIGDDYYNHGGFNEWAEANNIVVVYPQIAKSSFSPSNPQGCWDWWGYTNSNYAVRTGPQVAFVQNVITALTK